MLLPLHSPRRRRRRRRFAGVERRSRALQKALSSAHASTASATASLYFLSALYCSALPPRCIFLHICLWPRRQWSCWQVASQYLVLHLTHRGALWASGAAQAAQFVRIILRWRGVCRRSRGVWLAEINRSTRIRQSNSLPKPWKCWDASRVRGNRCSEPTTHVQSVSKRRSNVRKRRSPLVKSRMSNNHNIIRLPHTKKPRSTSTAP